VRAALALWVGFVLLVQRWPPWDEGIRIEYAWDVQFYELIARAAPGFPEADLLRAYAQRFPSHWLVGVLHDATETPIRTLYRVATIACLGLAIVAVHHALRTLDLCARGHALALGAFAASAYPVHYLLAAPGMLSDAVFVLGLSVLLLGFARGALWLALAGIALAVLGRQTALPLALAAAAWAAFLPAWRPRRRLAAALLVAVPAAIYAALHVASDGFSAPRSAGIDDLTVLGFLTGAGSFAEHVGLVVLGVLVPVALMAGAWLRTRAPLPRGPLLLAAAVAAQPLLLGPLANISNEPRLAGLAAPAFAVAAGSLLAHARLGTGETLACAAAIGAGGLHHRYTVAGWESNAAWVALAIASALVLLAVLLLTDRAARAGSAGRRSAPPSERRERPRASRSR
jgi:hypothetical protein